PTIDERSVAFWTGGADGQLRLAHCRTCGHWMHPPKPVCPSCRGRDIGREAVSGSGTVWSFTINRYAWAPGMEPPYVTAEAAIADAGLTPDDIDGVSTYPGAHGYTPGISGAGVDDVRGLLGLDLRWHAGGPEVNGQLGSVVNAVLAVAGGLAEHVLCFRTVWESTAQDVIAGGR